MQEDPQTAGPAAALPTPLLHSMNTNFIFFCFNFYVKVSIILWSLGYDTVKSSSVTQEVNIIEGQIKKYPGWCCKIDKTKFTLMTDSSPLKWALSDQIYIFQWLFQCCKNLSYSVTGISKSCHATLNLIKSFTFQNVVIHGAKNSAGAMSWEYGGWCICRMWCLAKNCCTVWVQCVNKHGWHTSHAQTFH